MGLRTGKIISSRPRSSNFSTLGKKTTPTEKKSSNRNSHSITPLKGNYFHPSQLVPLIISKTASNDGNSLATHEVQKTVLPNGLRIITQKIPYLRTCTLTLWIDCGSMKEEKVKNGISHLAEHELINRGTKRVDDIKALKLFDSTGSDINAFTSCEHTCFEATVLGEQLSPVLDYFLDMIFNPKLDETDIELEKKIILTEKLSDDDTSDVFDFLYKKALLKHPLSMPVIGTKKTISGLTKEDIEKHLAKFYSPSNIVISISGNFNPEEVITKIEKATSNQNGKKPEVTIPQLRVNPGVFIRYRDQKLTDFVIATKGLPSTSEELHTMEVLATVLGFGWTSRLFQNVRHEEGLLYDISSGHLDYSVGGLFYIHGEIEGIKLEEVLEKILNNLSKIKKKGFTKEELNIVKSQMISNLIKELDSTYDLAIRNGLYELYEMKVVSTEESVKKINAVSNNDLIDLANKIFNRRNFALAVIGPKKGLPTKESLEYLIRTKRIQTS